MNPFETLKERWQRFRAVVNSGDNAGVDPGKYRIQAEQSLEALIESLKVFMDSPQPQVQTCSASEDPLLVNLVHRLDFYEWVMQHQPGHRRLVEGSWMDLLHATQDVARSIRIRRYRERLKKRSSAEHAPAAEAPKPEASPTESPAEPLVNLVDRMERFIQDQRGQFEKLAHLDHLGVESEGHILEIRKVKGGGK